MWISSGVKEQLCILGRVAVSVDEQLTMIWRSLLPSSSGHKHVYNLKVAFCIPWTQFLCHLFLLFKVTSYRLRWYRGSMLAFGTQVHGFKPGRSHRIFKGEKIFSTASFGGEVKPSVPCRRFAACKRSLELRGSRILRRNLSEHFSPMKSSTFRY